MGNFNNSSARLKVCVAAALALAADQAVAQQASGSEGLEEVVVTAQRRSENLQTVPLAVTAFTSEALARSNIDSIRDVSERTPGLAMGQFNPGQPQIYMRGIGTNVRGAAEDPGVIVFVDEVYIARAQGSDIDLFDLDRVEVLRGPQGTLFGRNVIGGAISMYTRKPGPDTEWGVQGTAGDYKTLGARGYVSGALADNLFGKIAVSAKQQDSYLINHIGDFSNVNPLRGSFDDKRLKGSKSQSIRGQLRYQPLDNLDINLTLYQSAQDNDGATRHFLPGVIGPTQGPMATSDPILIPGYGKDYRNVLIDDPGSYESDSSGANLRFDVGLGDKLTLTSLTAYRYSTAIEIEPGLGTPALSKLRLNATTPAQMAFVLDGNNDYLDRDNMITQELRLTSGSNSSLQWVAGLYYLDQSVFRDETATLGLKFRSTATPGEIVGSNTRGGEVQYADNMAYAVFGQATYKFNDQWSVTAGARYTHDEKKFRGVGTPGGLTINQAYDVEGERSWSDTTPKVSLQFSPTSDTMFYASYAEGYKAGGFPNMAPNGTVASTAYNPEFATQYEIGAKTEWFDNRLRLNLAVFEIDYTDLQVTVQLIPQDAPAGTPGSLFTLNAADAKSKGAELEFFAAPSDRWLISGSLAYLDATFTRFYLPPGYNLPSGANVASNNGNDLRNAPSWAGNLLVSYTQPLSNGGGLSFQADGRYKDDVYSDPANLTFGILPAYTLVDFRVAYTNPSGNVEIAATLSNAFDEQYMIHNFPSLGMGLAAAGAPRMAALTVTVKN